MWTNRANSLDFERAVKIVYIYTNLRTLHNLATVNLRKDHVEKTWMEKEIAE